MSIVSLQAEKDKRNLESHTFEMTMPICGERVAVNGRYCMYCGRLSSYHVENVFIATNDWQKLIEINERLNFHLMRFFGAEMDND